MTMVAKFEDAGTDAAASCWRWVLAAVHALILAAGLLASALPVCAQAAQDIDSEQSALVERTQATLPVPDARRRTVTSTDGIRLAVYEYGPANAPTIVLVHGYPDTAAVWDQIVARLASQFHVVTYDTRGAGGSDHPLLTGSYALPLLSDDLNAVLDAAAPGQRVHLVGHDWGSIQTWESVAKTSMTGKIASFTSISGPSMDLLSHWLQRSLLNPAEWLDLVQQAVASSYIPLVELPQSSFSRDQLLNFLIFIQGDKKRVINPRDSSAGANLYRASIPWRVLSPTYDRVPLQNIQLIVPTRDAFVKETTMVAPVATAPGGVRNLVQCRVDAGHWAQLSNPDDVTQCILNFTAALAH
jgi:pimeloyl-ACP methyl ester carboxylesterase